MLVKHSIMNSAGLLNHPDLGSLVTHHFPAEAIQDAFACVEQGNSRKGVWNGRVIGRQKVTCLLKCQSRQQQVHVLS